ncbi:MAG: hypothetical protein KGQ66_02375 [Acidobacteriota bacterium]|nr:hypothetical protein [Acidobacteriota bacterium]
MGRPAQWIVNPVADVAVALSWVPFAVLAHVVDGRPQPLRILFAAVMFVSFAHQPLTFPLVYASPWRLATHRRTFIWFPVAALLAVLLATHLSMTLVAVVGGLWNLEHILMQRYGMGRMYGRKAGEGQAGVERALLVAWFLVPLLWVAVSGRLGRVLDRLASQSVDAQAARMLTRMVPEARVALLLAAGAAVWLTSTWLRRQRHLGDRANPAKSLYLASTGALFALAFVDPVAAVVGFVASHSIEYFVIVGRSVGSERVHAGLLGRLVRRPHGRLVFFGSYTAVVGAMFGVLYWVVAPAVLTVAVLTIGAIHFFFDAFIWKLRRPLVAASLVVPAGDVPSAVTAG